MYPLFIVAALAAVTLAQNPFLYSQPYAKRWEFEQLLARSQGLPKAEIDRRVVQWVGQQNPTIQQEWAQFNWRMQQAANEYQYRLARMSTEARKADQRLTQVANYPYFSAEEKGYLVHQIIDSLQPSVKSEILEVLMNARPVNF